jgi:hypothetical protein
MSTRRQATVDSPPRARVADVAISLALLVVFVAAYLAARDWPFKARLFPDMITIAGMALSAIKLVSSGLQLHRQRRGSGLATPAPRRDEDEDEDEDEGDASLEYVFAEASPREWARALAWITGFFVALYALGVFITVPAFAFAYLRFAGRIGWLGAGIYAAVAGGVIWLVFDHLLFVPMPAGIF